MNMSKINTMKGAIFKLLFPTPDICVACDKTHHPQSICIECIKKHSRIGIEEGRCATCQSFHFKSQQCPVCSQWPQYIKGHRSLLAYREEARESIHRFKYSGEAWRAEGFAKGMLKVLPKGMDYLVPVPLHPERMQERGYNQSALLAQHLASLTEVPFLDALERVKHTERQANLSKEARKKNMHRAFVCKSEKQGDLKNKVVCIIDDIFTTGATFQACAQALHDGGVKEIWGCSLASSFKK